MLSAFAVTLVAELLVLAAAAALLELAPWRDVAAAGLLANVVTHPLAWLCVQRWLAPGAAAFIGVELAVVGVEAALYARLLRAPVLVAAGLSLTANGASIIAALALPA